MKKVVGLLAGLCLCAGCENEIPEPTASVVSAGKFVVDYTAAAGAATRVIREYVVGATGGFERHLVAG